VIASVRDQPVEHGQITEQRIHIAGVGHVVAMIRHGRAVERGEPQRVDAQQFQIAEPGSDPLKITDAVPVGVRERPHVHLVEDRVVPPGKVSALVETLGGSAHDRSSCHSPVADPDIRRICS
jgi:hypothetical protein